MPRRSSKNSKLKEQIPQGSTATGWVARYSPGDDVDWRAVEIAAVSDYPSVLTPLDPGGYYNGGKQYDRKRWVLLAPVMVFGLFLIGAPVWGITTLFSQVYRTPSASLDWTNRLPVAGAFFALSFVLLVLALTKWLLDGRPAAGVFRAWSLMLAILAGLSAWAVTAMAQTRAEIAGGDLWLSVMVVAATTGAAAALLTTLFMAPKGPKPLTQSIQSDRVVKRFKSLPPELQQAVRRDLTEALKDLEAWGVIDSAQAKHGEGIEPGMVAIRMTEQPDVDLMKPTA